MGYSFAVGDFTGDIDRTRPTISKSLKIPKG